MKNLIQLLISALIVLIALETAACNNLMIDQRRALASIQEMK
jgi:hypothetical protein